jgi:hypothetical protein
MGISQAKKAEEGPGTFLEHLVQPTQQKKNEKGLKETELQRK